MNTTDLTCCEQLAGAGRVPSPFKRIIGFGWYGGLTGGVLQCGVCQSEYKFRLVARDRNLGENIYSLAALPAGSLDDITVACRELGEPSWPVWVPAPNFATPEAESRTSAAVDELRNKMGPEKLYLVMSRLYDSVLAATQAEKDPLPRVVEWFSQIRQRPYVAW
jgi:hypothetical protein